MLKKNKNIAQKLKTMELVHIYFIFNNTSTIITNFLAFFRFFPQNLTPLDPDPHTVLNADQDPQPCFLPPNGIPYLEIALAIQQKVLRLQIPEYQRA